MTTYYALLGVTASATKPELDAARRRLALQHHPDRAGGDGSKMAEVNAAYDALVDPRKRKYYNATLTTTHTVCVVCGGTGEMVRQKGFTGVTKKPCRVCEGAGCRLKVGKAAL